MKKNLVLTGMMGVGKSTVGKKLSKKLKLKFLDIDKIIEIKEKKTIKEIFEDKGEAYFREIEKKVTLKKLKETNLVVSLGGGAFLNSSVRKEIKSSAISVWLDVSLSSLVSRLRKTEKRPLLDPENLEDSINKIYSQRKNIYNKSDLRIKCDGLSIEKIVNKIKNFYEQSNDKG